MSDTTGSGERQQGWLHFSPSFTNIFNSLTSTASNRQNEASLHRYRRFVDLIRPLRLNRRSTTILLLAVALVAALWLLNWPEPDNTLFFLRQAMIGPQIFKHSSIGPAVELRKFGIKVIKDLPGVGENMAENYKAGVLGLANDNINRNALQNGLLRTTTETVDHNDHAWCGAFDLGGPWPGMPNRYGPRQCIGTLETSRDQIAASELRYNIRARPWISPATTTRLCNYGALCPFRVCGIVGHAVIHCDVNQKASMEDVIQRMVLRAIEIGVQSLASTVWEP
ncbi:hypothetical protein HYQ46_007812 [Verticillium longisporum]|nr:hypothetical protein HYQ46_007812 [Verticillium longisporum]